MMTNPFTPADGQRARWRYLYDLVVERKPGDEITRQEVMELLDCDEQQALQAMNEARGHLEQDKQRTVRTVDKFGWVVMSPQDNLRETERRRKKAGRAVTRAARVLNATPREELSQIERANADFQARQLLAASALYGRKPTVIAELEKQSKQVPQLPLRRNDTA